MLKLQQSRKWLIWLVAVVFLVILGAGGWWLFKHGMPVKEGPVVRKEQPAKDEVKPVSVESKVFFAGNSFWGRYTNDAAMKTEDPYEFPFARLKEFERDKYDAWVTGLECPTTQKGVKMTSAEMEATLTFNCDPGYLPEFAKWFDVVSLANNHTDNMGADGFKETQEALAKQKIQYFGHYDPDELDEICDVISLPVTVNNDDGSKTKGKLPVAMCGYHGVFKVPSAESVELISQYAKHMPVIVLPHSGAEYKPSADEIKQNSYHSMIDAGAEMIIGDHPHWIQNTEAYKGRLIAYSMGNFMFDQQFNQEVTRSAVITARMKSDDVDAKKLAKWLELGEKCSGYQDDCLEQASQMGLEKINLSYKFDFIPTNNKGLQVYPSPESRASVEQRLNWSATMKELGQ